MNEFENILREIESRFRVLSQDISKETATLNHTVAATLRDFTNQAIREFGELRSNLEYRQTMFETTHGNYYQRYADEVTEELRRLTEELNIKFEDFKNQEVELPAHIALDLKNLQSDVMQIQKSMIYHSRGIKDIKYNRTSKYNGTSLRVETWTITVTLSGGEVYEIIMPISHPLFNNDEVIFFGSGAPQYSTKGYTGQLWLDKNNNLYVCKSGDTRDPSSTVNTYEWVPVSGVGGSGGVTTFDVTAAVGQTIIVKAVDDNGKPTAWESVDYQPRTHWVETVNEPVPVINGTYAVNPDEGGAMVPGYLAPTKTVKIAERFTVNWNGVNYDCEPNRELDENGIALGNLAILDGTGDNGIPFVILLYTDDATIKNLGVCAAVLPLDGSETVTLTVNAIGTKRYHTIDNDFLDLYWKPSGEIIQCTQEDVTVPANGTARAYANFLFEDLLVNGNCRAVLTVDGVPHDLKINNTGNTYGVLYEIGGLIDGAISSGDTYILVQLSGSVMNFVNASPDAHTVSLAIVELNPIPAEYLAGSQEFLPNKVSGSIGGTVLLGVSEWNGNKVAKFKTLSIYNTYDRNHDTDDGLVASTKYAYQAVKERAPGFANMCININLDASTVDKTFAEVLTHVVEKGGKAEFVIDNVHIPVVYADTSLICGSLSVPCVIGETSTDGWTATGRGRREWFIRFEPTRALIEIGNKDEYGGFTEETTLIIDLT